MSCESCTDKAKSRNADLEQARKQAKIKSDEQKEAMAICEEITDGSLFTVSISTAISQRFAIREVIHHMQ